MESAGCAGTLQGAFRPVSWANFQVTVGECPDCAYISAQVQWEPRSEALLYANKLCLTSYLKAFPEGKGAIQSNPNSSTPCRKKKHMTFQSDCFAINSLQYCFTLHVSIFCQTKKNIEFFHLLSCRKL